MIEERIRISILDGFRAFAIIAVMFYHFFTRWTPPINGVSLYPYGGSYNYFEWGRYGVHFFFIISGFVIYFTLEKTENIAIFWKKRMIRLMPSIIIASLLTFFFFLIFDKGNLFPASHQLKNFIPSVLFINPSLINHIFKTNFSYINDSYWSLWPEIQFYFLSSAIYFAYKKKFVINFLIIAIVLIISNYLILNIQGSNTLNINLPESLIYQYSKWISNGFNLITYLPFFSLGIIAYVLFKNHRAKIKTSLFLKLCATIIIIYTIYSGVRMPVRIIYFVMLILFAVFIYYPQKLNVFENAKITTIGESSYFLYLIHEHIGVLLIYSVGQFILPETFVFPIVLIIGFCCISILFFTKIDKPINTLLKKIIRRKKLLNNN